MNEALAELFKHKTWATLLVIEALQDMDADVLDLTTPGTYGTIRATLQHLVAADESYLATITGKQREVTAGDGWRTPAAVPIAQAIHHAECHRGHVLSVIGAHGIELPGLDIREDLDVWHHGIAVGLMQETGMAQD